MRRRHAECHVEGVAERTSRALEHDVRVIRWRDDQATKVVVENREFEILDGDAVKIGMIT